MMVKQVLNEGKVQTAAQNISMTGMGAYTGELSAKQVADTGIRYCLTGHSERRTMFKETDQEVAKKTKIALQCGLSVILCIGEQKDERQNQLTNMVNARQLAAVRELVRNWDNIIIAYEPVWAIGTGLTASPEMAQDTHEAIRDWVSTFVSEETGKDIRIIYGGSVNDKNADALIKKPDIDGFLVGGASLKPAFANIVAACQAYKDAE